MEKFKIQVMRDGKVQVEEVEGERCKINLVGYESVEFFYHHPPTILGLMDERWRISEVKSGLYCTESYKDKAVARKELADRLLFYPVEKLKETIEANKIPVEVG